MHLEVLTLALYNHLDCKATKPHSLHLHLHQQALLQSWFTIHLHLKVDQIHLYHKHKQLYHSIIHHQVMIHTHHLQLRYHKINTCKLHRDQHHYLFYHLHNQFKYRQPLKFQFQYFHPKCNCHLQYQYLLLLILMCHLQCHHPKFKRYLPYLHQFPKSNHLLQFLYRLLNL